MHHSYSYIFFQDATTTELGIKKNFLRKLLITFSYFLVLN